MGIARTEGRKAPGRLAPSSIHAGRMFAHQDSLARLPVPPLQQTLYKYLLTVKPILNDSDYQTTKKVCMTNVVYLVLASGGQSGRGGGGGGCGPV